MDNTAGSSGSLDFIARLDQIACAMSKDEAATQDQTAAEAWLIVQIETGQIDFGDDFQTDDEQAHLLIGAAKIKNHVDQVTVGSVEPEALVESMPGLGDGYVTTDEATSDPLINIAI